MTVLVFFLLFNPQIFLQCWYGGTHHDSDLLADVFKCKRDRSCRNFNILLNLKKGTKMMQYFLYYTYYSQITNSAKVDLLLAFHLY